MRLIALTAVTSFLLVDVALAQQQGISVESAVNARKHLDSFDKPCLDITSAAQPLASNPRIFNHVVSLSNHCFEIIKVKVCYYQTDECSDVPVPPRSRKEQIIGVFPAMQQFRYVVKEIF